MLSLPGSRFAMAMRSADRTCRECVVRHQHDRGRGDQPDRGEFLLRVIAGIGIERRIDRRDAGVRHHDGVAVRRSLGGDAHADHAGDAAAIVDDHLLAEPGGDLLGDDPRHCIDAAAGRKRHDQGHRTGRIGGRLGRRTARRSTPRPRSQAISVCSSCRAPANIGRSHGAPEPRSDHLIQNRRPRCREPAV